MKNKFVVWHMHDVHSVRDGLLLPKEIIEKSVELNTIPTITNHGTIGSWLKFFNYVKNKKIDKVGYGCEFYVTKNKKRLFELLDILDNEEYEDSDEKKILTAERNMLSKGFDHFVIVAKNQKGFEAIMQLHNKGWDNLYNKPLIDYSDILDIPSDAGVLLSTACLGSILWKYKQKNDYTSALQFVEMMKDRFGDDFYLEVQVNDIPDQTIFNKHLMKLSEETNTKILIGLDAHYNTAEDAEVHQDLLLLQNKQKRSDMNKYDYMVTFEKVKTGEIKKKKVQPGKEFRKGYPIEDIFEGQEIKEVKILSIEQTSRVWMYPTQEVYYKSPDQLHEDIEKLHPELLPIRDQVFKNHYELYEKISSDIGFNEDIKLPEFENIDKILIDVLKESLRKLNDDGKFLVSAKKYVARLKHEFGIIKKNGFSSYFYILYDSLNYCRVNGIPLGPGRGSSSSSLVAYLLGITRIDPFNPDYGFPDGLPFERFLDAGKTLKKIKIELNDNSKIEMTELDLVVVKRGSEEIIIEAINILDSDDFIKIEKRFGD